MVGVEAGGVAEAASALDPEGLELFCLSALAAMLRAEGAKSEAETEAETAERPEEGEVEENTVTAQEEHRRPSV